MESVPDKRDMDQINNPVVCIGLKEIQDESDHSEGFLLYGS